MDSSIVTMEDSRTDLAVSASKPAGSIVQIDSISIDINCAVEEIEPEKHDHFSIREFVAGMWEKNRKTCMPFDIEDITAERSTAPDTQLAVRNGAATNSHLTVEKEKDGSLSHEIQQTDDGNRSSCCEDDDLCDKLIVFSLQCAEEHEGSRAETDVRDDDNEGGNTPTLVVQAGPLPIIEKDPNAAVENPSFRELENATSGSDIKGVSAAHRRRRKLRSLVDIMDDDKNSRNEKSRKGSTDVEADLEPQFHLDVPVEISKGTKSPQRKKKNVQEKDRGQSELGNPTCASERLKIPILNVEKTSSRVQIVDLESEGGASTLLDLRENAKTLQIKPKKNVSVDTSRNTKHMHTDSRAVPTREAPKIKEVEPHVSGFVSGQQRDRISKLSKGKAPVLKPRHNHLVHPSKNNLKNHNIQGELALNLSLNSYMGAGKRYDSHVSSAQHREIPDLNESFPEKETMTQGKEFPTLSEKRSSTLPGNLETTASSSKDATVVCQLRAVQNVDNNEEPGGVPDDIPMDIVELLAKNQRERALGNSKQQQVPGGINNSVRGSSSFYADRPTSTVNFPFTYTRGNMAISQGISNFPQGKISQSDVGNLFGSPTPRQQYLPSSLGWRPNEGTDLFWPPRKTNAPFQHSVNQHHSVQPHPLNLHSCSDHGYKGKSTVSSVKGDKKRPLWNALNSKSIGSIDAYSNDTIPAMQLLSLMDQGVTTSSSYKVGLNRFRDKPLSPCHHHPQMKANGNQKDLFLGASFFSRNSHNMGISRLINGISNLQDLQMIDVSFEGQMPPEQGISKTTPSTTIAQPSNDLELGVCTLSRNPADFSTPDERNEFTISCKDLKPRKRNDSKKRTCPNNADRPKKQRLQKNSRK